MTVATPPTWSAENYHSFVRLETSGQQAITHLALLKKPDGGLCRAYVKHYPVEFGRGLFNEWFGHTVFSALGIPQPPAAVMPAPVPGTDTVAWAFCSLEPTPRFEGTAKFIYDLQKPGQYPALVKRLFEDCSHLLPGLIAADQLLIHPDRNIGNIAFTGKSSFVAIDAGGILGGADCHPSNLLRPAGWVRSKLIEDLIDIATIKPKTGNALIAAAQCVTERFHERHAEIAQALDYPGHNEVAVCFDAVWWRTLELEDLFRSKLGILI